MADFVRLENACSEEDISLLKKDVIPFSVLASILKTPCEKIYTDHESAVICLSSSLHPVWIWAKDGGKQADIVKIASVLKEEFPLEGGFSYNFSSELLAFLTAADAYFLKAQKKMGLISYRQDTLVPPEKQANGGYYRVRMDELDAFSAIWRDATYEMTGQERDEEFCRERVKKHILSSDMFAWRDENGELAAICAKSDIFPFSKLSAVYTLPAFRRKGCASNLVSAVSMLIHEEGMIPILYTDEGNLASNDCYKKLGFTEVKRLITVWNGEKAD